MATESRGHVGKPRPLASVAPGAPQRRKSPSPAAPRVRGRGRSGSKGEPGGGGQVRRAAISAPPPSAVRGEGLGEGGPVPWCGTGVGGRSRPGRAHPDLHSGGFSRGVGGSRGLAPRRQALRLSHGVGRRVAAARGARWPARPGSLEPRASARVPGRPGRAGPGRGGGAGRSRQPFSPAGRKAAARPSPRPPPFAHSPHDSARRRSPPPARRAQSRARGWRASASASASARGRPLSSPSPPRRQGLARGASRRAPGAAFVLRHRLLLLPQRRLHLPRPRLAPLRRVEPGLRAAASHGRGGDDGSPRGRPAVAAECGGPARRGERPRPTGPAAGRLRPRRGRRLASAAAATRPRQYGGSDNTPPPPRNAQPVAAAPAAAATAAATAAQTLARPAPPPSRRLRLDAPPAARPARLLSGPSGSSGAEPGFLSGPRTLRARRATPPEGTARRTGRETPPELRTLGTGPGTRRRTPSPSQARRSGRRARDRACRRGTPPRRGRDGHRWLEDGAPGKGESGGRGGPRGERAGRWTRRR